MDLLLPLVLLLVLFVLFLLCPVRSRVVFNIICLSTCCGICSRQQSGCGRGQGHADICTPSPGFLLFFAFPPCFLFFVCVSWLSPSFLPELNWSRLSLVMFSYILPIVCFWFDCWQFSVLTFNEMSTKDLDLGTKGWGGMWHICICQIHKLPWHSPASFSVWLNAVSPPSCSVSANCQRHSSASLSSPLYLPPSRQQRRQH